MVLDEELAEFARTKDRLLEFCDEKFVVICGTYFFGAFESAEDAYKAGVQAFGRNPFLVKRVTRSEQVFVNYARTQGLINARI